ncbi:MAG: UDP-N-acetylmuramate dehydrogenase [Dehalococcoidia bacterium]|nr:UDP-N-acetylmuramate dehydrogenase [Dehalococcoidia bacterium]
MSKSDHPNLSSHSHIIHDESMKSYTYMNIGGKAKLLCKIGSIDDLCKSLDWAHSRSLDIKILGGCSNVLIDDNGWDGMIILLRDNMNNVDIKNNLVTAESGVMLPKLSKMAAQSHLSGLEFAIGIPGTLGGALYSNAGINDGGNIGSITKSVTVLRESNLHILESSQLQFSYRSSNLKDNNEIIISATLLLNHEEPSAIAKTMSSIINYRKLTQPASSKNAGSIFKNPPDSTAGELIEKADLKGYRYGGASVSGIHANFIVNDDNASAQDVAALMLEIQSKVYISSGILLEPEVEWISDKDIPKIFYQKSSNKIV